MVGTCRTALFWSKQDGVMGALQSLNTGLIENGHLHKSRIVDSTCAASW
jgi:hypothetical protein